ncbi:MAG TPA: orotidine 5'-phosphate decarboxylase / HUMPS family protein [Thermodesulfobacteriota bacterium]|nr:orotidine 5'-phosphate decarboxylase / HUMPS family protein [Thermodesulfobacteriota bacterium]
MAAGVGGQPCIYTSTGMILPTPPKEAISASADYIVVGRPVREAKKPVEAARKILQEV